MTATATVVAAAGDNFIFLAPLKINFGRNFNTSAGITVKAAVTLTSIAVPISSAFQVCG